MIHHSPILFTTHLPHSLTRCLSSLCPQCAQVASRQVELIDEHLTEELKQAEKKFAEARMRMLRGTEYQSSIEQAQGAMAGEASSSSSPFQFETTQAGAQAVKELEPEDWDKLHVAAKLPEEPDVEEEEEEERRKGALMDAMRQAAKIGMFGFGEGEEGEEGASQTTKRAGGSAAAEEEEVEEEEEEEHTSVPAPARKAKAKAKAPAPASAGANGGGDDDLQAAVKAKKKKKPTKGRGEASSGDPDDLAGAVKKKKTKKKKTTK
jgi:hypothetical protein